MIHWSIMYLGWVDAEDEFFSFSVTCKQESLLSGVFRQTNPSAPVKNIFYWKMTLAVIFIQLPPVTLCVYLWSFLQNVDPDGGLSWLSHLRFGYQKGHSVGGSYLESPSPSWNANRPQEELWGPWDSVKNVHCAQDVWALALCLVSPSYKTAAFYK